VRSAGLSPEVSRERERFDVDALAGRPNPSDLEGWGNAS